MKYTKPLSKCSCGKPPKMIKGNFDYVKYSCAKCSLNTFFCKDEGCARESFNAMINNLARLKVRI